MSQVIVKLIIILFVISNNKSTKTIAVEKKPGILIHTSTGDKLITTLNEETVLTRTLMKKLMDDNSLTYSTVFPGAVNEYYLNSDILKEFTMKEIIIISSLVEKEANNDDDRKMISSVIYNRLRKGMKLDIDATVIFSITKGMYKFDRSLNYEDLKIPSEYNTYLNKGLPPYPISFPGTQTIKIVLEDHDSPYYFYFFDTNKNSHIFSKDYKEHLTKLNEYRSR